MKAADRSGSVEADADAGAAGAVPAEMLWNVRSSAPMVVLATLSAVPVVVVMDVAGAGTVTVTPAVAWKPTPDVVVMSRPLPPAGIEIDHAPVLLARLNAVFAPVDRFCPPSKLIVPPVLLLTSMPLGPPGRAEVAVEV